MKNEILEEILLSVKNIDMRLDSIEEQQSYFSKEFDIFRKEQLAFNKRVLKELSDLRTDIDTIYDLEIDTRKTVKSHTEKLDKLIKLAKINQEQHVDFDKRISFLESVIS